MAAAPTVLDVPAVAGPPWWLRIAIKLVLARVPIPYRWWRRLGVFRHGDPVRDVERPATGFAHHYGIYRAHSDAPLRGFVEIGPGDSLGLALFAKAAGAERIWLVDAGDFALDDPAHYRAVLARLEAMGLSAPRVAAPETKKSVLAATGAVYATDGLAALARIDDEAVDLVMSTAALEHLPLAEFDEFLRQHFRILRPGGIGSHVVDLRDHLGGSLNHLRFPTRWWERRLIASSGFYTNRLSHAAICARARAHGFAVSETQRSLWPEPPLLRARLAPEFRGLPDDELRIAGFALVLQKPFPVIS